MVIITHDAPMSGSPQLADCRIHDNEGSGIFVQGNGRGWLEKCFIWANKMGDTHLGRDAETEMRGCMHEKPGE